MFWRFFLSPSRRREASTGKPQNLATPRWKSAHLLLVLAPGGVQRLDEGSGVADEHGVAGGTHNHAQHGQPDIGHTLGCLLPVANAQHVAHSFEQSVRILLSPRVVLKGQEEKKERNSPACFLKLIFPATESQKLFLFCFAEWRDSLLPAQPGPFCSTDVGGGEKTTTTHHHVIDGNPTVFREVLQHGDQEL